MSEKPSYNPRFKPDHIERFEKHLKQIELSRTDDFVISSIKLTFFAGWAAAMDSLSDNWLQPRAQDCKDELQQAVARYQQVVLLADSSKFDNPSFVSYAALKDVDIIISDGGLKPEQRREYESAGVRLFVV